MWPKAQPVERALLFFSHFCLLIVKNSILIIGGGGGIKNENLNLLFSAGNYEVTKAVDRKLNYSQVKKYGISQTNSLGAM